ncbi:ATP-binding protein [Noviherbaspirillum sp. CPCC 100848]|uniref:ATP-binding protein n=1 Tax=Noviherbaspirillum album TaxID=3080276 RepID=A0ABU6JG45_9BURK|nr:ATP-binding protein [Noviherbaspirillum sp. CPCC 100848]MEC4722172.1 ATP-binding protein [Noviherbaspirillum sp. CPCC 100848]
MFHIKSLEMVHWDYWQRVKNIPLDAKIITIAGQNGSGKTTLLDALRTLFGLDCSMGRSYKHYARHAGQQTSWLRAVVDNRATGRQLSNRPFRSSGFFSEDEVTLFCQIQKNGGDWKRQYLMRPGAVEIEEVQEANDWLGLENYRKRLANAGLSPAMAKVLALEQGETDKLCEYAPRQLLDLVFQVFGDKEVLDAYDEAKRHQRDTETELQRFEAELESAQTNQERLRLRAANYHQWEGLNKEQRDLQEEVLPTLQYHELREKAKLASDSLRDARRSLAVQDAQLADRRNDLAERASALSAAHRQEAALEDEKSVLEKRLGDINTRLKPLESLLEQKSRLQKLAADAGADIADVAAELEQKESEYLRQRQARDELAARIAADRSAIAALESKTGLPDPENVRAMRRALSEAGIAHSMLPEIVEVTDPRWQGAVEGMLRGYTSVILLEHARDAAAAYRIGEKERYGHFIVPERVTAPEVQDRSLLSVVRFSAKVPPWLIDQLGRVTRVDSAEAGMKLSGGEEWITPEAYHRERRGGRSVFVEASRYRFGQAGRAQRIAALQQSLPKLEAQEDQLTIRINKLAGEASALKARIAGVDAAKELVARQAEFDEAGHGAAPLKAARTEVGTRLGELFPLIKKATEERTLADNAWQYAKRALVDGESGLKLAQKRHQEERAAHAKALSELRRNWRHLPHGWRRPARRLELAVLHQNAHQVNLRIGHLASDLAREDWETDSTVVDQHVRLSALLQGRQAETEERRYQNNRAIEATNNARGAYIDRLRYTIKTYSRNIKELGELANIEVHTDPVRLENDDVQLAQAGLQVRFKFDGKGPIGLNDGEASGGQQVMKSLILLIGLLKSDDGSGGFVFIDEPFAHLDIRNIQLVGEFLKNTDAQYLMTTPLTHNTDVYDPSELTLITSKKKKDTQWAQPIFVLQRRAAKAA